MIRTFIRRFGKYGILFAVYAVLLLPMLQDLVTFDRWIKPLHGSFTHAKDTAFSWQGWFSGGYQVQKEKFLRDSFGLHNHYIRLNNQLNFNLYKKANAVYVVVGKANYLYETGYFDAFFGTDFIGRKKADSLVADLSRAQSLMAQEGKLLLPVFAAGKASYYPEFIPNRYHAPFGMSNYLYLTTACRHKSLDFLDFNRLFVLQKRQSPYPLYPQYGIHWSNYGALLAFDSIVRFVENRMQANLPDIEITRLRVTTDIENTDDDIIKGMNLLWEPRTVPMAYPEWKVVYDTSAHKKLKLLVVADSFWWYIYSTGLPGGLFESDRFWFYNELMYPESFTAPIYVKDADYKTAIRNADVILVLHTEATLSRFGGGIFGMIDEALAR